MAMIARAGSMTHSQALPDQPWVTGDTLQLPVPADLAALRRGGAAWLTLAFRAMGTLAADNGVVAITRCEPAQGGGTGAKALLSVRYARPGAGLPEDLFVKFSRNFADPAMDAPRFHMAPEVLFAALSRQPGFPVVVPLCLFADFHAASGTGVLITERIAFGQGGIERQYGKCLDHDMPDPLAHYATLIGALARLAGAHRGGRLPDSVATAFPFAREAAMAADTLPYTPQQRDNRVARYAAFAAEAPRLVPEAIRTPAFLARFAEGFALFQARESAIHAFLLGRPEMVALCHWNANADNAWYWRDPAGMLQCGLLDWGNVGQITVAQALWGCLSSASQAIWCNHLDALLALFGREYHAAGGPALDPAELRVHFILQVAMMGLRWLLDAPPRIRREVADIADCSGPRDPRILASETARVQLQMLTNVLMLWHAEDVIGLIARRF